MFIFILLSLLAITLGCIAWFIYLNVSESEKECKRYFKDMQSAICNRREKLEEMKEIMKQAPITPEHCLGARMTEKHAKFHDDLANCHFGMNELSDDKVEEPSSIHKMIEEYANRIGVNFVDLQHGGFIGPMTKEQSQELRDLYVKQMPQENEECQ